MDDSNIELPEIREFDEERRHLLGAVMIPNRFDLHGDGFTENEVEYSCHYYNKNHFGSTDINHLFDIDACCIIESYILEVDTTIGGVTLSAGTWMAKLEVAKTHVGDVVWEMLRNGELEGFSPEGSMYENKIIGESNGD